MIYARKGTIEAAAFLLMLAASPAAAQDYVTTRDELLDRVQIEDIMYNYYGGLDSNDPHDFANYYTDDALMDINGRTARGRTEIQAFYNNYATMSPGESIPGTLHVLLNNPRIVVDGDKATVNAIWTEVNSDTVKLAPRVVEQGTEYTEFRKVGGRWLMSKRVITNSGGLPDAYDESYKAKQGRAR